MKKITLKKQKANEPKFDELYEMLSELKDFLAEDANPKDEIWKENLNTIIDFQDEDGSFKLFTSYNIPIDAKVDFCYNPTYICSAILMKAYLTDPESFDKKALTALSNGLKMSCAKNLRGHGYEALKGQIEALNIFAKAGLNEFLDLYGEIFPEFSGMIEKIISKYQEMEDEGKFHGPWGESYKEDIKSLNKYFCQRLVFVYGTLMSGEANSGYLQDSTFIGPATIEGYDMYDVGWYPAIIPGDGLVIGELYQVSPNDIPAINGLEAEGYLYEKKCETVPDAEGNKTFAFVYVYLKDTSDLKKIQSWRNDYIWYVSYGSNMLKERFMKYIEGGSFKDSRYHPPCSDTTPPVATKAIEIPYDMYFANESGSWHGSGVSFLDTTRKGKSLGVAYLITTEQLGHVTEQENNGRIPQPGYDWYEDIIDLDMMDGFEVKTITNHKILPYIEQPRLEEGEDS